MPPNILISFQTWLNTLQHPLKKNVKANLYTREKPEIATHGKLL